MRSLVLIGALCTCTLSHAASASSASAACLAARSLPPSTSLSSLDRARGTLRAPLPPSNPTSRAELCRRGERDRGERVLRGSLRRADAGSGSLAPALPRSCARSLGGGEWRGSAQALPVALGSHPSSRTPASASARASASCALTLTLPAHWLGGLAAAPAGLEGLVLRAPGLQPGLTCPLFTALDSPPVQSPTAAETTGSSRASGWWREGAARLRAGHPWASNPAALRTHPKGPAAPARCQDGS
mmetsp:Transcript_46284/g.108625  ORF Transcript_46284/g.108625 Transcript_46284/m.108625 type:complete len:244 (+) Transcript_46284:317-1048(+)